MVEYTTHIVSFGLSFLLHYKFFWLLVYGSHYATFTCATMLFLSIDKDKGFVGSSCYTIIDVAVVSNFSYNVPDSLDNGASYCSRSICDLKRAVEALNGCSLILYLFLTASMMLLELIVLPLH